MLRLKAGFLVSALVLLSVSASPSLAGLITVAGSNPYVPPSGSMYIPLSVPYSGAVASGYGLSPDSFLFAPLGASSGYITMVIKFDLTGHLLPDESVDLSGLMVTLNLFDLDFLTQAIPVPGGTASHRETMGIAFMPNSGGLFPSTPGLVVDDTNYGNYRTDGFGATDNVSGSYTFALGSDLGATPADVTNINADKEFAIALTFRAMTLNNTLAATTVTNSPESVTAQLLAITTEAPAPEPASMVLLAVSGLALLRRRRNSAAH